MINKVIIPLSIVILSVSALLNYVGGSIIDALKIIP